MVSSLSALNHPQIRSTGSFVGALWDSKGDLDRASSVPLHKPPSSTLDARRQQHTAHWTFRCLGQIFLIIIVVESFHLRDSRLCQTLNFSSFRHPVSNSGLLYYSANRYPSRCWDAFVFVSCGKIFSSSSPRCSTPSLNRAGGRSIASSLRRLS